MTMQLSRKRLAGSILGAFVAALLGSSSAHADLKNVSGPGGHSYDVIVDQNATWSQAQASAATTGGHLVSINSAAEQAFIEQLLTNANAPGGEYWIGLKKIGGVSPGVTTASNYAWTTGQPQNFQHWLAGQPDNNGGNESVGGVLWSQPGDSTFNRRGFWNDLPDNYHSTASTFPDLNNGGYIVERSSAVAVPLPPALFIAPLGMVVAWRARRWVTRR
jgi:hypothetical protein